MNICIPMAGLGSRFRDYGFKTNKYLLPVNQQLETMIEKAITTINAPINSNYVFVLRQSSSVDVEVEELKRIANKYFIKNIQIKILDHLTEGPASTVYEARELFDYNLPLLVSNSDQVLDWNSTNFFKKCNEYDGCVLTYKPDYPLVIGSMDKHSFIKVEDSSENSSEKVTDFSEKIVLSDTALIGVHYYKSVELFERAYEYMVANNIRAPNNELYLSLTYKALLTFGLDVGYADIEGTFYPVGEPSDYFSYLDYKIEPKNIIYDDIYEFKELKLKFIHRENTEKKNGYWNNNELVVSDVCTLVVDVGGKIEENNNNTNRYKRGWFIGNFEPTMYKTSEFEVGFLFHGKGERWDYHYHKEAVEHNFLINGSMILNDVTIPRGSYFKIERNQIACPVFLEDCYIVCVKLPSIPGDKFVV
jgi:dTDP-glucose pyrophosphorylase